MEFHEVIRDAFVMIGYSSVGKWDGVLVYPISSLWRRAESFIGEEGVEEITSYFLSPRCNQYFYTCGIEIDSVNFHKVRKDVTLHTFPENMYVVFAHRGQVKNIPASYEKIWRIFDRNGYSIKAGLPEIEIVQTNLFGKEECEDYEMEIWIPVE
jgi:AraC family transcriptional regulator